MINHRIFTICLTFVIFYAPKTITAMKWQEEEMEEKCE